MTRPYSCLQANYCNNLCHCSPAAAGRAIRLGAADLSTLLADCAASVETSQLSRHWCRCRVFIEALIDLAASMSCPSSVCAGRGAAIYGEIHRKPDFTGNCDTSFAFVDRRLSLLGDGGASVGRPHWPPISEPFSLSPLSFIDCFLETLINDIAKYEL